jgi:Glycosyltransferase family 92
MPTLPGAMILKLGSRRYDAVIASRRGKKFTESTMLKLLFIMLGVILILYLALMVLIANYVHRHPLGDLSSSIGSTNYHPSQQLGNLHEGKNVEIAKMGEWKDKILKAYIEPVDQNAWDIKPLPIRDITPEKLKVIEFPKLKSCSQLTKQWPVDDYPEEDPFLPWIHDVFPTHDGKFIQFVAQNKRRCDTGMNEGDRIKIMHRQPQISLFQHVPVKRLEGGRYRLASHEEADADGLATRFICRFKPGMEETLSVFNLDYDYVSFRKNHKQTFTKVGQWDLKSLHTSQLLFQCPVPDHLQQIIMEGTSVINDFATMFLDIIPIRTPPRYGSPNTFLTPRYSMFLNKTAEFKTEEEWGKNHVLPVIENCGRWENVPICKPSLMTYNPDLHQDVKNTHEKPHRLISCLWASSGYATRGERFSVNDGKRRLREWLHYVFLVGFQHVYVYDNSLAQSTTNSLRDVTDQFPGKVTRIVWPSKVCNVSALSLEIKIA